jgi:hypothetical protein
MIVRAVGLITKPIQNGQADGVFLARLATQS